MMHTHLINEQVINLQLGSSAEAARMQEEVRDYYFSKLLPEIEAIFNELSGKDELLIIDNLELDLGEIGSLTLDSELKNHLRESIIQQVNKHRNLQVSQGSSTFPLSRLLPPVPGFGGIAGWQTNIQLSAREAAVLAFHHFLETGQIPWWKDIDEAPVDIPELARDIFEKSPVSLMQLLPELRGNPEKFRRLIFQFNTKAALRSFFSLIGGPQAQKKGRKQIGILENILRKNGNAFPPETDHEAWLAAAFTELYIIQASPETGTVLTAALLRTLPLFVPGNMSEPFRTLYTVITERTNIISSGPISYRGEAPLLRLLLEWENTVPASVLRIGEKPVLRFFFGKTGISPARVEAFTRWKRKEPVIVGEITDQETLVAVLAAWTDWPQDIYEIVLRAFFPAEKNENGFSASETKLTPAQQEILEILFGSWPPAISAGVRRKTLPGKTTAQTGKKTASQPGSKEDKSVINQTGKPADEAGDPKIQITSHDPAEPIQKPGEEKTMIPGELLKAQEPVAGKSARLPEGGVATNYAGLVLISPFLPGFFRALELTDGKYFADARAAARAVFILHYIATGKTRASEHELFFHKLLCGLPPETALPDRMKLTASEKKHAAELLSEVAKRWERLKTSSGDMIRNSFMQRKGRITETEYGYLIRIERTAIDILIDTLPWSISVIRAPWMKRLLQAEW
ncbi:MAG: hypothetical protein FD123_870 [Bacteroidetes bacterium]|nr:MAG: hypothetical protein FD123_870 [Bacteroidota bacterium]